VPPSGGAPEPPVDTPDAAPDIAPLGIELPEPPPTPEADPAAPVAEPLMGADVPLVPVLFGAPLVGFDMPDPAPPDAEPETALAPVPEPDGVPSVGVDEQPVATSSEIRNVDRDGLRIERPPKVAMGLNTAQRTHGKANVPRGS